VAAVSATILCWLPAGKFSGKTGGGSPIFDAELWINVFEVFAICRLAG